MHATSTGSDVSTRVVSPPLVHVPVADGTCRVVPEADLQDRSRALIWTTCHSRFVVGSGLGPPEIIAANTAVLVGNHDWQSVLEQVLTEDVTLVESRLEEGKPAGKASTEALGDLLYDCPALVFWPRIQAALARTLTAREPFAFQELAERCRAAQKGAKWRGLTYGAAWLEAWTLIENWKLEHGGGADRAAHAITAMDYAKGSKKYEDRVLALKRAYHRRTKQPHVQVRALAVRSCAHWSPGGTLHAGTENEPRFPDILIPQGKHSPRQLRKLHHAIHVRVLT